MFYPMKVFPTTPMPPYVWEFIKNSGSFVRHGYGSYTVGCFAAEVEAANFDGYDLDSYTAAKHTDSWFISNGANQGEEILIKHGD